MHSLFTGFSRNGRNYTLVPQLVSSEPSGVGRERSDPWTDKRKGKVRCLSFFSIDRAPIRGDARRRFVSREKHGRECDFGATLGSYSGAKYVKLFKRVENRIARIASRRGGPLRRIERWKVKSRESTEDGPFIRTR